MPYHALTLPSMGPCLPHQIYYPHPLTSTCSYLVNRTAHGVWNSFCAAAEEAESVDHLKQLHYDYLERIRLSCLQGDQMGAIQSKVGD